MTFNTFAMRGAIRNLGASFDIPKYEVDAIARAVESYGGKDTIDKRHRDKYPELFEAVDLMIGVIFAMGSHPSGFIVSPIDLDTNVSTLYTRESKYKVTAINMNELEGENYVKLDILGLMNIELINETCDLAGIERLTPDNVDIDDIDVWRSLQESTLGVFQFESDSAYRYLQQLFSDETLEKIEENTGGKVDYIDLLSMANGAIRPSGNSYRNALAQGETQDNDHPALNKALESTLGYLIFQEQIMSFLSDFANHSGAESDTVRRGLSSKDGTHEYLPKIREGFVSYMIEHYDETEEHAEEILESFLQVIEDASDYGFSVNHSTPYSYIGYIGAYLRHHYPLEFLTVNLNLHDNDMEQTGKIMNYAKRKGVEIRSIEFGRSRAEYSFNREEKTIYKGIASIKYLNGIVAEELFELSQENEYDEDDFVGLLRDIIEHTSANTRQMEILIRLDFFRMFGPKEVLLETYLTMVDKKKPNTVAYPEFADQTVIDETRNRRTGKVTKKTRTIRKHMKYTVGLKDNTKEQRLANLREYEEAVRNNPPRRIELHEQIAFEKDNLGYAVSVYPEMPDNVALVLDVNKRFTPRINLYRVSTGEEISVKVKKNRFWVDDQDLLVVGDIIQILESSEEYAWRRVDGRFERDKTRVDLFLDRVSLVRESGLRKQFGTQ